MTSEERWRPVPGFEGLYEISDRGRLKSLSRRIRFVSTRGTEAWRVTREKILRPLVLRHGYIVYHLRDGEERHVRTGHELVLAAFVGPRPDGKETLHANGDRADNRLENLRYGTRLENRDDSRRAGTLAKGERIAQAKLTADQVLAIRAARGTHEKIAAVFGVSRRQVGRIRARELWRHVGEGARL